LLHNFTIHDHAPLSTSTTKLMKEELFATLLQRFESDVLDFKLEHHNVTAPDPKQRERKRAQFAKDILAFSNVWRDEPRHIVIGVKPQSDGTFLMQGVSEHVDSADLVRALDGLVHPCPHFDYIPVEHDGKHFGIIEIKADRSIGPFFAVKDVGGGDGAAELLLRKNALYCRRASVNVEANREEQKAIWAWFSDTRNQSFIDYPSDDAWARFVELSQITSPAQNFVLLLALSDSARDARLTNLAGIDWSLVIDLDPASQLFGALKHSHDRLARRRAVHVLTLDGKLLGEPGRSTCWYFPAGLQTTVDPIPELRFRDWVSRFGRAAAQMLEQIAAACSGPTSVIILCEDSTKAQLVRRLAEEITANFGERATCIALTSRVEDWSNLEREEIASIIPMAIGNFLDGLEAQARAAEMGSEEVIQLPGVGGVPKDIAGEVLAFLEEDLELVHLAAGNRLADGDRPIRQFLTGGQISWFELGLQADVEREKLPELLRITQQDLFQRRSSRINLYHEPGSGGSTIARRVVWLCHQKYPCVVLRRCSARETAARIARIYQITGQSVLILREGSDVPETEADQLANLLAGARLPSVLLQVLRRYTPPTSGMRSTFLAAQLTTVEAERFRAALTHEVPSRRSVLDALVRGSVSERRPFLFGLAAFADEFAGLRPYVQNHLREIPAAQIKVLQFLALAHDYGQQTLAASHFAEMLQVPPSRPVIFEKLLSEQARGLLVEHAPGRWRPLHQLVSGEILELTLSSGSADTRLWKAQLGELARAFVRFCRTTAPVPPDELQAIVEQVCVRRNDAELLSGVSAGENRFSRLVSELPTADAKLMLFEQLVDEFPDNPHFWAHLGRYYSIGRKDFGKAEEAIDRAIVLNEGDHVLHHMKGMVLRNLAFQLITGKEPLAAIVSAAKRAADCFQTARNLAPNEDYGYISDAQMTIRILDYARGAQNAVTALANETVDPWLREGFERVEDLLSTVREQRRGQAPNGYEEECRAQLDVLYGAHDQALQRWDQLLQRKTPSGQPLVYAPSIRRQIVWVQLARCERQWDQLSPKHLQRSLDLLEANIQQEPDDDRNIRLWLQGARFLTPPPALSAAADRVATWRMRGDSLDAIYYLYVLKVLEALDGSAIAADDASKNIEICKTKAGFRRDRTHSFEWLSDGQGLRRLAHQDQLGGWDNEADFWRNTKPLLRIQGTVTRINAPQSGEITIRWGMKVFFVPAQAGMSYGQDENRLVTFFLGFSYEGLRAWSVQPVKTS
jgi:tetratricopeptide (TPR) repeat protein